MKIIKRHWASRTHGRGVMGEKATIHTEPATQPLQEIKSNFEALKHEIKVLENSQFLSLKYRMNTEPAEDSLYATGKHFLPGRRVAKLEKVKQFMKKRGKDRKVSLSLPGAFSA